MADEQGAAGQTNGGVDEELYERLIAEGKSERIARAKARAAAVRRGGDTGDGADGGVATASRTLSASERRERVETALAGRQQGLEATGAATPGEGSQRIRSVQDTVFTWPHLISQEAVAALTVLAALTLFSAFAPAPLQELANPDVTPNPSKAPWYFMGLQEMLIYLHPMIAGITIPGIVAVIGLILLPFIDKNPSVRPDNRKTAYALFTTVLVGAAVLTMIGSFFRGPGQAWFWPWVDGIWFVL
ncbi:menaquinol-cytochrome c reductase cytochrome b subunit [Egibacter rhizosphaerae]|uniref:Menaquinol-cytochrome c reductase cytochrome b subunit n=1 Tax=Egibacter rhizosphaerae TaxID=1670831 RepID=A0A411YGJ4_9ACTN|nr:menaquinol-cytochrome c reductase cytochrome b subunit [Egibacter rhizosphaerae]QBI20338.1 menaquinol-cytochrome c reductase cytochrome b subunit [Egibacter rhizosphaerae]